jgi:hypothetical protein
MAATVNSKLIKTNPMDEDHIGTQLMRVSANMRRDVAELGELTSRLVQMFQVSPADYTLIESELGLAAGEGVLIWGYVNGANTQIVGDAAVQKLMNWLIAKPV